MYLILRCTENHINVYILLVCREGKKEARRFWAVPLLDRQNTKTIWKSSNSYIPAYRLCRCAFSNIGIVLIFQLRLLQNWFSFVCIHSYPRKVTMLQLNDSKFIAIAIYNVAIPSVIVTPLVLLLDIEKPNVTYTLTAACITFGTTITNCLIFLPKVGLITSTCIPQNLLGTPCSTHIDSILYYVDCCRYYHG